MAESNIGQGGISVVPGSTQGVFPQWMGWYYATVSNNADPLNMGRVQLRIPQVLGTGISTWAWALTTLSSVPAASPGQATATNAANAAVTPPPIGTVVAVTFLGGSLSDPAYMLLTTSATAITSTSGGVTASTPPPASGSGSSSGSSGSSESSGSSGSSGSGSGSGSGGTPATIEVVQTSYAYDLTTGTASFKKPTTKGNCVVVIIFTYALASQTITTTGITLGGSADNFQQAIAVQTTPVGGDTDYLAGWIDPDCAGGQTAIVASVTNAEWNGPDGGTGLILMELSGVSANPLDVSSASPPGQVATVANSGMTKGTSTDGEMAIGAAIPASAFTAFDSAYTNISMASPPTCVAGYMPVPTAGSSVSYTATANMNNVVGAIVFTLKPALTGGTGGLAISTTTLAPAVDAVPYSASILASGGIPPYTFSASGLPSWATMNAMAGVISGTPSGTTSSAVTAGVADSAGSTASASLTLVTQATSSVAPVGPGGNWALAFEDLFPGTALNPSNWTALQGANINSVTTQASAVSVSGGYLRVAYAGAVNSNPPNDSYGSGANGPTLKVGDCVEAYINFPSGNTWSAWWAAGPSWPAAGEEDIAEILGSNLTALNYHSPSGANNGPAPSGNWFGSFHTYTLVRGASTLSVYWDGKLMRSISPSDNGNPQSLIINMGGSGGSSDVILVKYVRMWTPA